MAFKKSRNSPERRMYRMEQSIQRATVKESGFPRHIVQMGRHLARIHDSSLHTSEWVGETYKVGHRLGRTHNWEDLKSLLHFLRDYLEEKAVAHHVQRGAQDGAKATREGRDPSRSKRRMKRSHPMAPYFAWVKKNHRHFQKPNGQLDMKRMWKYWKTHHG